MSVTTTEGLLMIPRLLLGGMLSLSLFVTGCSALRVSTSEQNSKPVEVGLRDSAQATPEPTEMAILDGMEEVAVTLGEECPISVEFAIDRRWGDGVGYSGYWLYSNGDARLISVNCYAWGGTQPQDVTDEAMDVTFSESGSRVVSEKVGETPGGVFWTVQGVLGPSEVRSIASTESVLYGAVAGIRDDGRLYKVSVEMVAKSDDAEATAVYAQMLPTVRFAGNALTPPPGLN